VVVFDDGDVPLLFAPERKADGGEAAAKEASVATTWQLSRRGTRIFILIVDLAGCVRWLEYERFCRL